jgi:tetratricopeptide (TPR) repeat protein
MVLHSRGQIAEAAEKYREAGDEARAAGDVHAAAVCELNRATTHSERGRFGAALAALDAAITELVRLGEVAGLAAAHYNRGIALLALGEIAAAARAAEAAALQARTPQMEIYARLLSGDVSRRRGDLAAAQATYARARAEESQCERELMLSLLNLAEVRAEPQDRSARQILTRAEDLCHSDDDRDRLVLSTARVALCLGAGEFEVDALARLEATAERARASGRVDHAWRCAVLAGHLAGRLAGTRGDLEAAKRPCRDAHTRFEAMLADTLEAHRDGLRRGPDACSLAGTW